MTNGFGTKSVPKDIRFESLLLKQFHKEKFEKIIYYDAAIIVKDGKRYGKFIICDDSIYSFIDALNSFSIVAYFKDIFSVEMLSDKPMFIFGHQRNKAIHIRIKFYKYHTYQTTKNSKDIQRDQFLKNDVSNTLNIDKSQKSLTESQNDAEHGENSNNNNDNSVDNLKSMTITNTEFMEKTEDSIDYYILNMNSAAFPLLKKARIDYLIRETMSLSVSSTNTSLYLSQSLLNRLFDELCRELELNESSLTVLQEHFSELIKAGNKYYRVKVLFWSKPTLYEFTVLQFKKQLDNLISVTESSQESIKLTYTYLNCLNVLLNVFNTYFFETDHFASKFKQLRINNGKMIWILVKSVISLIAYLNDCDKNSDCELHVSDLEHDIDCLKHSVTFGSIELFYYFLCASEGSGNEQDDDPFTCQSLVLFFASLTTFNSDDGIFNKFINQSLRMQFIWIFPKMFKFEEKILNAEQIINIYQYFRSLGIIMQRMPKFFVIFRKQMEEEFEHFILNDLLFPLNVPLASVTVKILKSFQKNMIHKKEVFIDYF